MIWTALVIAFLAAIGIDPCVAEALGVCVPASQAG
jgi:hypothetical protein